MTKYSKHIIISLSILFCFSVLKHLQYPLLWNDEAETAMLIRRTMEFGYPKVHDGKNVLHMIRGINKHIAINESTDAYTGFTWGMIYFGIIGELLASTTNDIYLKTGLLRLPFAFAGIFGVFLLGYTIRNQLSDKQKDQFIILYLVLLLFNVHLQLHLREVRYYPLIILIGSIFINLFFQYRFNNQPINKKYLILQTAVLWISFHVFSPLFFILVATLVTWELFTFLIVISSYKQLIINSLPSFISLILLIPVFIFFKSFELSAATAELFDFGSLSDRVGQLKYMIHYFINFENVYLTLFILIWFLLKNIKSTNKKKITTILFLLGSLFIIYIVICANIPSMIWSRYLILLMPLLSVIATLLLTSFSLKKEKLVFVFSFLIFLGFQVFQYNYIKGHVIEMTKQYKGVLDYTIPWIMNNYENTEALVVAANYEECAYMYYLNSKVTYGFTGNNLTQDTLIEPDIVAYRPVWDGLSCMTKNHLNKFNQYEKISFDISDYSFNNNPEFKNVVPHLFEKAKPKKDLSNAAYLLIRN